MSRLCLRAGAGTDSLKGRFFSVDPYMRERISPAANYAKSVALGEVLRAGFSPRRPALKNDISEDRSQTVGTVTKR
jgi:hypothetical protein